MTNEEFTYNVLPLKNKLYCFAVSLLKNPEEAKDVVQETMLKIWSNNKKIEDYINLESWCMTLVRNQCLDLFKKKGRNNLTIENLHNISSSNEEPLKQLENSDLLKQVKEVISNLPKLQQEIIHLRDFQNLSYKEIAEIIKIDISNVKVNIHRARKTIKEKMNKRNTYGLQSV